KSRMQGKVSPEKSAGEVYVGIDVCKAGLDIYVHPAGVKLRVANARDGALLAESLRPAATPPAPVWLEQLQELVRARQAAVAEATALVNRRGASQTGFLKAELARRLKSLATH